MLGRHVLELVRLVEDHGVVIGQDLRARMVRAQREIREVQVMVDEDQIRLGGRAARAGDEAPLEVRTARADARVGRRRDLGPHRIVLGEPVDLGAISRRRFVGPEREALDRLRRLAALRLVEPAATRVVRDALQDHRAERTSDQRAQEREVVARDLILQRARAGRDDHALAARERGHEVRERLAGAGAGLDEQRPIVGERARDRRGHHALLGAILVVRDRRRQRSARREDDLSRRSRVLPRVLAPRFARFARLGLRPRPCPASRRHAHFLRCAFST